MMQDDDEYDVFRWFVASEAWSLKQDFNRRRLKCIIQRAILVIAEDDKINTDTPNSDRRSVCTPIQGISPIQKGFISWAESVNSSTRCMVTYEFPEQNSQITLEMQTKSKLKSIKFCLVDLDCLFLFINKRTMRSICFLFKIHSQTQQLCFLFGRMFRYTVESRMQVLTTVSRTKPLTVTLTWNRFRF